MSEPKTCLVLGAGASASYGLPTATQLRDLILLGYSKDGHDVAWKYRIEDYRDDQRTSIGQQQSELWQHCISSVANGVPSQEEVLKRLRKTFFHGRTLSIDKFLQEPGNMKEFGELGRMLIATVLLNCERPALLDKGWYAELFSQITPNGPHDLRSEMLSVVTFNYDRSLEIFMWTALRDTFRLTQEQLGDVWKRLTITHAYGDLGGLDERDYGTRESKSFESVKNAAARLELMRVGQPAGTKSEIAASLNEATTVCFIGFGFAPENLALFDGIDFKKKRLVATSVGLSKNRAAVAQKAFGKQIKFIQGDGEQLLQEIDIFQQTGAKEVEIELPTRHHDESWVMQGRGWTL